MTRYRDILRALWRCKPVLLLLVAAIAFTATAPPSALVYLVATLVSCLLPSFLLEVIYAQRQEHPWQLSAPLRPLRHITIEGDLLVEPRCLAEVRLPFAAEAKLQRQPSALLWASAAMATHTLLPEAEQQAVLAALKPLGFVPEKFLARCTIIAPTEVHGQKGMIVRDGKGQRAYFLGQPSALLADCSLVWDQQERPVTAGDAALLPPQAEGLYGLAMAPVEESGIGPMTYLGSLLLRPALRTALASEVERLARLADVYVTPPAAFPACAKDVYALSHAGVQASTLHLSNHPVGNNCYVFDPTNCAGLAAAIENGQLRIARVRQTSRQLLLYHLVLSLLYSFWHQPALPLILIGPFLMLPLTLCDPAAELPLPRLARRGKLASVLGMLWTCAWCGLIPLFLRAVAPDTAFAGLLLGAMVAGTGFILLPDAHGLMPSGWLYTSMFTLAALGITAGWLIFHPPVLVGLFGVIAGILTPLWLRLTLFRHHQA